MLTSLGTPSSIQAAKGQYIKTCHQFKSDFDLTNEIIRVKVGLFTNGVPNNQVFTWQSQYVSGGMTYISSNVSFQNYDVTLEVLDNFNYRVCVEFIASEDWQGFSDDNGVSAVNSNFIQGSGPAYTSGSSIAIHSQIGTDSNEAATCYTPIELTDFCNLNYTLEDLNGNTVTGYTSGQDLKIRFGITGDASATFYAGFYDETGIGNNQGLPVDLGLSYAQMAGTIVNPVGNLPTTCLKTSIPINSNGVDSQGCLTIDGSCLNSGCYRAYIIYKQDGEWLSCVTDQICLQGATAPKIDTEFACLATQGTQSTDKGCIFGLSSCLPIELCVDLDVAAYDAALLAAGLTGTATDYLQSVLADIEGVNYAIDPNGTNTGGCVQYTPVNGFTGIIEASFTFTFDFGSHKDILTKVFELNYENQEIPNAGTFDQNGDDVSDVICAEDEGTLNVNTGITGDCKHFLVLGNKVVEEITGSTIPVSSLSAGAEYCIKSICQDSVVDGDCECPDCGPINVTIEAVKTGAGVQVQVIPSSGFAGSIDSIINGTDPYGATFGFNCPGLVCGFGIDVILTGDNGCVYTTSRTITLGELNNPANVPSSFSEVINIQGTGKEVNCDCPDEIECGDQFISILAECDEETGVITVQDDITSITDTIKSDSGLEQSTDNITWSPAAAMVSGEVRMYYRRVIVTENCGTIQAFEQITCSVQIDCLNNRQITHEINTNCELILTITDTIGSAILQDRLCVTINGVKTVYDPASSYTPITLNDGDEWSYESSVIVDGCVDVIVPLVNGKVDKSVTGAGDCDFSGYGLTCAKNDELGTFTIEFTGDPALVGNIYPQYNIGGTQGTVLVSPTTFEAQGLLQASWILERAGCPIKILSPPPCYIKEKVEVCNLDELDVGIGDIIVVNNNCCDCPCSFTALCDDCILEITVNSGCDGMFLVTGPGGYSATGTTHDLTNYPEGEYTITFTFANGDCDPITQTYNHDKPELPNPIQRPPIQ